MLGSQPVLFTKMGAPMLTNSPYKRVFVGRNSGGDTLQTKLSR